MKTISKLTGVAVLLAVGLIIGMSLGLSAIADFIELTLPLGTADGTSVSITAKNSDSVPFNGEHWDIQPAAGYRTLTPMVEQQYYILGTTYNPQAVGLNR